MLKKTGQLSLVSAAAFGVGCLLAPASEAAPQTSLQEIVIDGSYNQVDQQLNQTLEFGLIYLPELDLGATPQTSLQEILFNGENNQVDQQLNQILPDFLLPNNRFDKPTSVEWVGNSFDDFLGSDLDLDTIQFSTQETLIDGNNNQVAQKSEQSITNFFLFDDFLNAELDKVTANFADLNSFNKTVNDVLDNFLDTVQFSIQETLIDGSNNRVNQEIEQNITSFLLFDGLSSIGLNELSNYSTDSNSLNNIINDVLDKNFLDPIQLGTQRTFIDGNHNQVNQEINQTITDFFFLDPRRSTVPGEVTDRNLGSLSSDIEDLIDTILNDTVVEARQANTQKAFIDGDDNQVNQENRQVQRVGVPEPTSTISLLGLGILCTFLLKRKASLQKN